MNNRIQELYLQAAEIAAKEEPSDLLASQLIQMQKFAELIVRECANRSSELGQPEIGQGLIKHFGVA